MQQHETRRDYPNAPFQASLLSDASTPEQLQALLPASYITGPHNADFAATQSEDLFPFIADDLDLGRLVHLSDWFWVAGRPVPPHPLHYQRLLGREIIVAEQMDLHLVWTSGRIYIKPLPLFLLEPAFYSHLSCRENCCCSREKKEFCDRQKFRRYAVGFLFSYVALIRHNSDLSLAIEKYLLPETVEWAQWRQFVAELLEEGIYDQIDDRFHYGELRLSRLNKLQYLASGSAYMPFWNRYGDFFHDNNTWLASTTVYIAVVLTAMQVGLATSLATNEAFQAASYGFTIFSILGPLIITILILGVSVLVFLWNWAVTVSFGNERLRHIRRPNDLRNERSNP